MTIFGLCVSTNGSDTSLVYYPQNEAHFKYLKFEQNTSKSTTSHTVTCY